MPRMFPILNSFGTHLLQHFEVMTYEIEEGEAQDAGFIASRAPVQRPIIQAPAA